MTAMNYKKYHAFPPITMDSRAWPDKRLVKAPIWCSVDLRDGNQALENPMTLDQKLVFFQTLVDIGFKTIEIGFPAASETEYAFTRYLIENNLIPDDVSIQVLTQSREHIIDRTFDAVCGAKNVIIHLYNSTSTLQRRVVFGMKENEIQALAVDGAKKVLDRANADTSGTNFIFEYSPESFSGTEVDFAVDICDNVCDVWQPTLNRKVIINLPNTVEMATPNIYADQIEYFCTHTRYRERIIVSLHAHNDRGCGVAATELGLMAGADRVEGTLFGNGERTGNADILTLALNLFSQGTDPELDFSDINNLVYVYESCTGMKVYPRQPYAGDLVYTAFSGSHQDAINKGMHAREKSDFWEVPYLPIDPADVGRSYDPIIRINSQSGKGGVAYILKQRYGMNLPKSFQQEFSQLITHISDARKTELLPEAIKQLFDSEYVNISWPLSLISFKEETINEQKILLFCTLEQEGKTNSFRSEGNGIVDAFVNLLSEILNRKIDVTQYNQHAQTRGADSKAMTYVQIQLAGKLYNGCGLSSSISKSSLRAVISAVNRSLQNDSIRD